MGGENLVDQMADFHNWVPLSTAHLWLSKDVQRVDQITASVEVLTTMEDMTSAQTDEAMPCVFFFHVLFGR